MRKVQDKPESKQGREAKTRGGLVRTWLCGLQGRRFGALAFEFSKKRGLLQLAPLSACKASLFSSTALPWLACLGPGRVEFTILFPSKARQVH
jgi:hypothetical protein